MDAVSSPIGAACTAAALLAAVYFVKQRISYSRRSNVARIPGPPSRSWLLGNMMDFFLPPEYGTYEMAWQREYGPVYRLSGCLGTDRLMLSDPLALQALMHGHDFEHDRVLGTTVGFIFGKDSVIATRGGSNPCLPSPGVECVSDGDAYIASHSTGADHKRLRAALSSMFNAGATRGYVSVVQKAALEVVDFLDSQGVDGRATDVCPALHSAALRIISEIVVSDPDAVSTEYSHVNAQLAELPCNRTPASLVTECIMSLLPPVFMKSMLAYAPGSPPSVFRQARDLGTRFGHDIVRRKLEEAEADGVELDGDVLGEMLKSVRTKGNKHQLTDGLIADQAAVLIFSGQETTASTLTFSLWELARNPELQAELRDEIVSKADIDPDPSVLENMPLLNAFIKEALRLYPAEASTDRTATVDTVLPMSQPIRTPSGEVISEIRIRKGQLVTAAIGSYQRLESCWGPDAQQFRPSRWLKGENYQAQTLGAYANLFTFWGGARMCLGWRLAVLEMQVMIFELLRRFTFSVSPEAEVKVLMGQILVPVYKNKDGKRMKGIPLMVKRLE
ncbi:unnamed protein product [Mycena citricolor]|uniref:Cytochrome P450 n=1 Tax=Mycena citricolor TaxID=2018698 RepID=A0AAD2HBI9_9AGAR|nr:unnamed protein product [Mycena citricolor]